jgi:large subunit ribosomal protein L10
LVVRKGETISERLASVLSKLGIKPVEAGLAMKVAYDDGLIITQEQLRMDINETKQSIEKAYADVFTLSLSIAYPTLENMEMLVKIAHKEAYTLALNAAMPFKETIADLIRKAHMEMSSLNSLVKTETKW